MDERRETNCQRCGARCKVNPIAGSKATMLKRGKDAKGLCVNCAAHDWLRNTYPANLLLAQSGPRTLAFPHIQEQFAGLMKMANSDARPDEINWELLIANWDLPFPSKVRARAENPADQEELDREPQRYQRQLDFEKQQIEDPHKYERELGQAVRKFLKAVGSPNANKPLKIKDDPAWPKVIVDCDGRDEQDI
jgi:hypothetical protein